MEYILIIIGAVFVNNIVLAQFLGICPFIGVSSKVSTSAGMSGAVMFVMTLATVVTYLIYTYILVPFEITFLQTISYILVIAALVQMVEIILKKVSPALYQALGIFLPLITTNCAVMGVCLININEEYTFVTSLVTSISYAAGFGLALVLFAGVRERILLARVPKPLQDTSIGLVTAGMLALTFYAFKGMV